VVFTFNPKTMTPSLENMVETMGREAGDIHGPMNTEPTTGLWKVCREELDF
jgi:hypothetical protein